MLRILPRFAGATPDLIHDDPPPSENDGPFARLRVDGLLTPAEAGLLCRMTALEERARLMPYPELREAIARLDAMPSTEIPDFVESCLQAVAVRSWVSRPLSLLRRRAVLHLPDMGDRYQRLRAILVVLLVMS